MEAEGKIEVSSFWFQSFWFLALKLCSIKDGERRWVSGGW
jgi:hypothetical protein